MAKIRQLAKIVGIIERSQLSSTYVNLMSKCTKRMVEDAFPGGFFVAHAKGTGGQASDGPPGSRHAPGGPRFTHAIFGGALVRTLLPARTTLTQREEKRWCGRRHGLTNARNRANQPSRGVGEREQKSLEKSKGQRERRDG